MTNCRQRHSKQSGAQQGMLVTNGMMPNGSGCQQFIGRRGEYCRGLAPIAVTEGRRADELVLDCIGWFGQETCVADEDSRGMVTALSSSDYE